MARRIVSNPAKISYVTVALTLSLLSLLGVGLAAGMAAATALWCLLFVSVVGFGVRNFRGPDELVDPPRTWWRMTARPASGFVFTALFLAQSLSLVSSAIHAPGVQSYYAVATLNLVAGLAFLNSSLRLRAA